MDFRQLAHRNLPRVPLQLFSMWTTRAKLLGATVLLWPRDMLPQGWWMLASLRRCYPYLMEYFVCITSLLLDEEVLALIRATMLPKSCGTLRPLSRRPSTFPTMISSLISSVQTRGFQPCGYWTRLKRLWALFLPLALSRASGKLDPPGPRSRPTISKFPVLVSRNVGFQRTKAQSLSDDYDYTTLPSLK